MRLTISAATVNLLLLLGHVYFGAGFLVGGPQYMSSPSYDLARSWMPEMTWGWAFVVGAVCTLAAPHMPLWWESAALHVLAALAPAAMTVALVLNIANATGWGGPVVYLMPVLVHGWIARARYLRAVALAEAERRRTVASLIERGRAEL